MDHKWGFPVNRVIPTIYKYNEEHVTLLYTKHLKIPKTESDLYRFNKGELIGYFNLFGYQLVEMNKLSKTKNCMCDICGKHNQSINYIIILPVNECHICDICKNKKGGKNIYENTRFWKNNIIIDMVEDKYDIMSIYCDYIYIHYHTTFKFNKFNYRTILYEPWYQRCDDIKCMYCKYNKRYFHSMCQDCFNFSYKITFKHVIIAWLSFKKLFTVDINFYLFTILLELLNYNINLTDLTSMVNPKMIKEKEKEKEEDLITEDNLYSYIKFDLNDDYIDDSEELWYW